MKQTRKEKAEIIWYYQNDRILKETMENYIFYEFPINNNLCC